MGDIGDRGLVLVVGDGNVARSAYVERRLAHLLDGSGIRVASAGTGVVVARMSPSAGRSGGASLRGIGEESGSTGGDAGLCVARVGAE